MQVSFITHVQCNVTEYGLENIATKYISEAYLSRMSNPIFLYSRYQKVCLDQRAQSSPRGMEGCSSDRHSGVEDRDTELNLHQFLFPPSTLPTREGEIRE